MRWLRVAVAPALLVGVVAATPASAKPVPAPNTVIKTVSLSIIPEFSSADPGRGVVWMTGLTPSFSNGVSVEVDETTGEVLRTVNFNDYAIGGTTIDPTTGNLIMGTVDGRVVLIQEDTGMVSYVPAANNVNTLAEGIGVDTVTGNIYVTGQGPNYDSTVSEISEQTNSVIDSFDVPTDAEAVAVDSASGKVYISTIAQSTNPLVLNGAVLVVNEKTNKVVDTIQNVGNLPYSMDIDPISGKLFVSDYFSGSVVTIKLKTNEIADTITIPNGFAADGLAVDPANGMVYVNGFDEGVEWVINERNDALVATISVPDAAGGLSVDPSHGLVFAGSEAATPNGTFAPSLAIIQAAPASLQ
jgi:hypothetical protein